MNLGHRLKVESAIFLGLETGLVFPQCVVVVALLAIGQAQVVVGQWGAGNGARGGGAARQRGRVGSGRDVSEVLSRFGGWPSTRKRVPAPPPRCPAIQR